MEIQGFDFQNFSQSSNELSNNIFIVPFEYLCPLGPKNKINNCIDDNYSNNDNSREEEDEKENEKQLKRQRRIKKKIQKDKGQINLKKFVIQNIPCRELFKLNSGIYITLDGVLRFCYTLSPVSFGFCPNKIIKIEDMHNLGIINITQTLDNMIPKRSIDDCVDLMMHRNLAHLRKQDVQSELVNFDGIVQRIYNFKALPKQLRIFKENEYNSFIQHAYKYIEQLQKQEKNCLISYVIGRYNYVDKDVEISHQGMSKSYLSLLGLDYNSFKSIILRNQKVDLIHSKADIILQALNGIILKAKFNCEDTFSVDIITFDGYPLQINYNVKNITLSQKLNEQFGDEYILGITKVTVPPKQMQGLIEYRKKLMENSDALSIDEYINKELSYLFEDVEYSVQSQKFLEKYYKENLQDLYLSKNHVQCGYRQIQNDYEISEYNDNNNEKF